MPSAEAWIVAFAARLGVPAPSDEERAALLRLASVAAHDSERRAAPIACWVAAQAGVAPTDAAEAACDLQVPPTDAAEAARELQVPPTDAAEAARDLQVPPTNPARDVQLPPGSPDG